MELKSNGSLKQKKHHKDPLRDEKQHDQLCVKNMRTQTKILHKAGELTQSEEQAIKDALELCLKPALGLGGSDSKSDSDSASKAKSASKSKSGSDGDSKGQKKAKKKKKK